MTKESFKMNIIFLKFFGLYPSDADSLFGEIKGAAICFILPGIVQILIIIKCFNGRSSDALQANLNNIFLPIVSSFCFKVPIFVIYKYRIKNCIDFFEDSIFNVKDAEEQKLTQECVRICQRNTIGFIVLVMTIVVMWTVPFLLAFKMPYDVWVPYDVSNPWFFYPTFFYLIMTATYGGLVEAIIDPLIGGMALHATTHLKILKYNLEHLGTDDDTSFVTMDSITKILKNCVKRHHNILAFIDEFEECFSYVMFAQFAGSLMSVCFSLIGLIQMDSLQRDSVLFLLLAGGTMFQILFYCYYGTLLYEENEGFIQAIYMGPWYKYDVRIRKVLITMMERSKEPVIITAGKVVTVTLQTFASVMKTSYSLIAVFG